MRKFSKEFRCKGKVRTLYHWFYTYKIPTGTGMGCCCSKGSTFPFPEIIGYESTSIFLSFKRISKAEYHKVLKKINKGNS